MCDKSRVQEIKNSNFLEETENVSKKIELLAHPIRLSIIVLLNNFGDMCVCEVMEGLDIKQSTASYHLKALVDADLVDMRYEARWTYYSLKSSKTLDIMLSVISSFNEGILA
ncbi:MAG TPA: ArsR family transcriptional regulator [Euryarchaeota archaeon]|nr:arsenical resistance operon repressor [archaeon BMS3Abin16]GBE56856.1 arsenical resistance operon repressor [archaeon BMS3Bbin16]HDH27838.1 ArsR family transcriptional regulator [Euryarchaeota archaeon]